MLTSVKHQANDHGQSFFIIILPATILMLLVTNINAKPVLKFDRLIIDLGEISDANSPEVVFNFQNIGDSKLSIDKLVGTCPCQEPRVTQAKLLPGETGKLYTKVIPTSKSGPAIDIIKVHSNAPENPLIVLQIKRFVKREVQLIPDRLVFDLSSDVRTRKVTVLGPTNDKKFELKSVDANKVPIEANCHYLGSTDDFRKKWQIDIRLNNTSFASFVDSAYISIATSSPLKPLIKIPIRIVNHTPMKATPSSLSWLVNGNKYNRNKIVSVSFYYKQKPRNMEKTELDTLPLDFENPEYLRLSLLDREQTADHVKWLFEISLFPDKLHGTITGQIKFSLKSEDIYLILPVAVINL